MTTPTAYLIRTYTPTHTRGLLVATDAAGALLAQCVTLELPWRDNLKGQSCIPEGIYQVCSRQTTKFGMHYHVQDVPGREWILFHPGTYVYQLLGCILPGERFADIDKNGVPDILNTRATLNRLLAALGPKFILNVFTAPLAGGTLPEATVTP